MKALLDNIFPCYDSSTDGGNDMTGWTHNESNSEVIDVVIFRYLVMEFTQLNVSHYRWCGHQLLFVEYFAKFTNTRYFLNYVKISFNKIFNRIRLLPMLDSNEFGATIFSGDFHIALMPIYADTYAYIIEFVEIMEFSRLSSVIDYYYTNRVVAATRKGNILVTPEKITNHISLYNRVRFGVEEQ